MKRANPTLSEKAFNSVHVGAGEPAMTVNGTVTKAVIMVLLTLVTALIAATRPGLAGLMFPAMLGGFIVALVVIFKQTTAPALTPVYAILEGAALGWLTLLVERSYPGIAMKALVLTTGVFLFMLVGYRIGIFRLGERAKACIVAATCAIALTYLVDIVMGFFGNSMVFLHDSSPLSIGLSVVFIIVAALNLLLDFDFIAERAESGTAPKYLEWYGAFALLVTLVWLYVEILRLLRKLRR